MGLETGTYINDLVTTNPDGAVDSKSAGDDHLRLIKSTVKATFPNMAGAAWRKQGKSGDYALAATDNMSIISCTAALTITAVAATVGSAFLCLVRNDGIGRVVINGLSTNPGTHYWVASDGSTVSYIPVNSGMIGYQALTTTSEKTFTGLSYLRASRYVLRMRAAYTGASPELQLLTGSGSIDTGNNYQWVRLSTPVGGSATTIATSAADSKIVLAGGLGGTPPSDIEISLYLGSSTTMRVTWSGTLYNGSNRICVNGSGWWDGAGNADRVQLKLASSTWSLGSAELYEEL